MIIVVAVLGFFALVLVLMYNGLVGKKNQVENAFSSVDVQLKQRHDLIPNLVATVKNYMSHERGTLEELTRLRSQAMAGGLSPEERAKVENQIGKHMSGIMVAVENYPQLKADTSFVHLQKSLNEVEAQIAAARRTYNAAVTDFNNALEMFPTSFMANAMGYKRAQVLVAEEAERKNINVAGLFNSP